MKRLFIMVSLLGSIFLSGCATVQMAADSKDIQAKSFATKPDRATLYIYRTDTVGSGITITLLVNDKAIGKTAYKTFFALDVPPGKYTIISVVENFASLVVNAEAGKNYYIMQEVKVGFLTPSTPLHLVDEKTGQAAVLESGLIYTDVKF